MKLVEVIRSGSEQSIHLPTDCHIDATAVFVKRLGRSLLLIPKDVDPWQMFSQSLGEFTDDFMQDRSQPTAEERRVPFE
jgi:antitoxin VapB